MLLCQQGGGHQHRNLPLAVDREERGAQRHLGLAEADIAAHQPVHRFAGFHVGDHLGDDARLIRRLFEGKRVGKRLVMGIVRRERMPRARRALGVDIEQFGGRVPGLLQRPALGLFPGFAAELVQRRVFGIGAGVACDEMQAQHRNVELVAVGVLERENSVGPSPMSSVCRPR